jgi:quinolinate synthase
LKHVGFNMGYCELIAPLTLEINELKKKKGAVILAHSYQTPDIMYGVADFVGDSYGLSKAAEKTKAKVILFAGVRFMAETAKILNPEKKVLLPSVEAGCSLADAITAEDVRALKKKHPGIPVVCYVNTTAEVKAECDACCTSANALKIVEGMPGDKLIFVPDVLMARNLQKQTKKKLIYWPGKCIVHEDFKVDMIDRFRKMTPGLKVLSHLECPPDVIAKSDMAGGTGDMIRYVKEKKASAYMLVTECGMTDRMKVEYPEKRFVGMCSLCPYMKKTNLQLIRQVLKNPKAEQVIKVPERIRKKAASALKKMFELS